MLSPTVIFLLALSVSQSTAQFLNQTDPFSLVLLSSNNTINGTHLSACHEGAAIEGLCLGGTSGGGPFQLNYTTAFTVDPAIGTVGYLTYELHGGNFNLSSPMTLSYNPISNVAVPLFTPSESGTEVAFDGEGKLNIPGSADDTVSPPVYKTEPYYRWYACETDAGYLYQTLAWALGDTVPQNPTCQKVDVVREFV